MSRSATSKGSKKRDIHSLEEELFAQVEAKKKEKKAKSTKPPLKKRKLDEESDDYSSESSSDVEDDEIMEDFEEDESAPMEVDAEAASSASSDDDEDDEPFNDGYDDELYGDDEDRKRLLGMTEREREEILSDRYAQRKELKERYEQKQRLRAEKRKQRGQKPRSREPSSRSKRAATTAKREKTDEAMAKLKEQRKARGEPGKDLDSPVAKLTSRVARGDERDKGKGASSSSSAASSSSSAPSLSRRGDAGTSSKASSSAASPSIEPLKITLADLNKVRLSRQQLEEFVDKPFFDKLAPGFYVRVVIGQHSDQRYAYRIAEIAEVKELEKKKYRLGKKDVIKLLSLRLGASVRDWRMDVVSNGAFDQEEWDHWVTSMRKHAASPAAQAHHNHVAFPTQDAIEKKAKDIEYMRSYQCTPEDIEAMIAYKQKIVDKPRSIAKERARLVLEKEAAVGAGNDEEVQRITKQLEELDQLALQQAKKESLVAKINKKNKDANFEVSISQKLSDKPIEQEENDPFSRRWTKPEISVWSGSSPGDENPKEKQNGTPAAATAAAPAAPAPAAKPVKEKGAAKEKKLAVPRQADTAETLVKAHDFDLDIDIKEPSLSGDASAAATAAAPTTTTFKKPSAPMGADEALTPSAAAGPAGGPKTKTLSLQDYFLRRQQLEAT